MPGPTAVYAGWALVSRFITVVCAEFLTLEGTFRGYQRTIYIAHRLINKPSSHDYQAMRSS